MNLPSSEMTANYGVVVELFEPSPPDKVSFIVIVIVIVSGVVGVG